MHNSKAAIGFLIQGAKSFSSNSNHSLLSSSSFYFSSARNNLLTLLLILPQHSSSSSFSSSVAHGGFRIPKRGFCGYATEQFSDDEYDCDFENHQVIFLSLCFRLFFQLFICIVVWYWLYFVWRPRNSSEIRGIEWSWGIVLILTTDSLVDF